MHRLERPRADVQRDVRKRDAGSGKRGEHRLIEMQTRRRRGDRARVARVYRLIARFIVGAGGTLDIRRKGHGAVLVEVLADRHRTVESQLEESIAPARHHCVRAPRKVDHPTDARRVTRTKLKERLPRTGDPLEQQFDLSAGGLGRPYPRLDHPRVVEDEKVVRCNETGKIGEDVIGQRFVVDVKQPTAGARGRRGLRDQLGW